MLPREISSTSLINERSKKDTSPDTIKRNLGATLLPQQTNSTGRKIKVGDTVQILNARLFRGDRGVVTNLGKARISLKLTSGRNTNRKSTNLEVIPSNV